MRRRVFALGRVAKQKVGDVVTRVAKQKVGDVVCADLWRPWQPHAGDVLHLGARERGSARSARQHNDKVELHCTTEQREQMHGGAEDHLVA